MNSSWFTCVFKTLCILNSFVSLQSRVFQGLDTKFPFVDKNKFREAAFAVHTVSVFKLSWVEWETQVEENGDQIKLRLNEKKC